METIPNRASDAGPDIRSALLSCEEYLWRADEDVHDAVSARNERTRRMWIEEAIKHLEQALEVL